MTTISPALNGFLKGLLIVLVSAAAAYVGDVANLTPLVGASSATIIAAIVSALESKIRQETGQGLLGAVNVR